MAVAMRGIWRIYHEWIELDQSQSGSRDPTNTHIYGDKGDHNDPTEKGAGPSLILLQGRRLMNELMKVWIKNIMMNMIAKMIMMNG